MEINKLIDQFIMFLENKGRSHSTVIAYKKDIDQLLTYISKEKKDIVVSDVNTKLLNQYVESLKQSGEFTLKTISRKINSLKTFFKYLLNEKLIVKNPADDVKHPTLEPQAPRVLSPLEYRALRDTSRGNPRLYTIVELLLQTGITIGELSRLKRSDIKVSDNNSHINISEFSTKSARKVEVNEVAQDALKRYLNEFNFKTTDSAYTFITKSGRPILIRNIRAAINRAFEKAGITNATVNDIRNTFIVTQLENGMDINKLAKYVGHQKSTTTERYLTLVQDRPKRKNNRIQPL